MFNVLRLPNSTETPTLPKNLEFDMAIDDTEWAGNLIIIILDRKFTTSFDNYSDEIFTVESRLPFMHCLMFTIYALYNVLRLPNSTETCYNM